ncbi:protein of unknown function [Methylotuvimicrobium alcaliphilum 20Z]|uniref:Uncharacterized protein n=1 Tax=Methylotuvimicrobium alcaliphilum (strain DSM 19304 / NCIMB 14124 / VKM B-2133 / 20Z) TaxID=1091494 RepID=G4T1D7_META2|nr:protein of unknown function [Methylotuvimicrobium alcaliphilum 20Z]
MAMMKGMPEGSSVVLRGFLRYLDMILKESVTYNHNKLKDLKLLLLLVKLKSVDKPFLIFFINTLVL